MSVGLTSPASSWRLAWRLGFGALVVLAPAGALAWYGGQLERWQLAALGAVAALLALTVLCRLSGRSLFGPILFYDLLRSARQGRHALFRCLYLAALLAMLFLLYANRFGTFSPTVRTTVDPDEPWASRSLSPNDMARFAEAFFETFATVQFVIIALLTPGCTAGAIAEEKERRTIDYLLTTDLRPPEIVLGKLTSRLAYLGLLLLTGLPVLGLLQLLGGVDPQLVLAAFAATGVTMLSLASLSILNSVLARRPRTAILLTYVEAAVYLILTYLVPAGLLGPVGRWVGAGNILLAINQLREAQLPANVFRTPGGAMVIVPGATTPGQMAVTLLYDYTLFHGVVAVVCLVLAVLCLRSWSRWQGGRRSQRTFAITFLPRRRPRVSRNNPVFWKELYVEPMFRFGRVAMPIIGTLLYTVLILGAFFFLCLVVLGAMLDDMEERVNTGVRVVGTLVMILMLLGVAVRAASSIGSERDRQTFDSLLSSPLANDAILRAKWLGSLLSVRRLGWYLGAIWVVGLVTGGLNLLALPLLALALFVYGAFLSSLGLVCSLFCKSTTRATLWTLVSVLGLAGGPWLCGMCCNPFLMTPAGPGTMARMSGPPERESLETWVVEAQRYGLTPPLTLAFLAFSKTAAQEKTPYDSYYYPDWRYRLWTVTCGRGAVALLGLGCYAIAAWILWAVARGNFTRVTGRMPLPPDRYLRGREGVLRRERRPEVIAEKLPGGWG